MFHIGNVAKLGRGLVLYWLYRVNILQRTQNYVTSNAYSFNLYIFEMHSKLIFHFPCYRTFKYRVVGYDLKKKKAISRRFLNK